MPMMKFDIEYRERDGKKACEYFDARTKIEALNKCKDKYLGCTVSRCVPVKTSRFKTRSAKK